MADLDQLVSKIERAEKPALFLCKLLRNFWGGCCDGVSYHDTLKSDNIENAKREFEAWYKQYLMCCVERLEDALAAAKEEYENFLQYHKEV